MIRNGRERFSFPPVDLSKSTASAFLGDVDEFLLSWAEERGGSHKVLRDLCCSLDESCAERGLVCHPLPYCNSVIF